MGRTKGALNKRTKGVPAELSEKLGHRDPAAVLGDYYSMPLKQLQKLMRSDSGARAVLAQISAAGAAMPYKHSKMPQMVTIDEVRLPKLIIAKGVHQLQQIQALMKDVTPGVGRDDKASDGQVVDVKGEVIDESAH